MTPSSGAFARLRGRLAVRDVRSRVALRLGITAESRAALLVGLRGGDREAPSYWVYLSLAILMATLGLALDSTPTVIGAMLVSPLMSPIIDLSLSLLVGAAWPMVRSVLRLLGSVALALAAAVLITWALPYAEPTPEVLARSAPTALDLLVAICCAVAAALTASRPVSGAATMAAGTAIGISLVPPLCAAGFAAGIGHLVVAEGALLLFTANICAILAVATTFFWLVGFEPISGEQSPDLPPGAVGAGLARLLHRAIASRVGVYWRLAVPALLLLAVFVPLERALLEVSWQVRTRTAIARIISASPELNDALAVTTVVERGIVSVHAVIVGSTSAARAVASKLARDVTEAVGIVPNVHVSAVPPAAAAEQRAGFERDRPPTAIRAEIAAERLRQNLETAIGAVWPSAAGPIIGRRLSFDTAAHRPAEITIVYRGAALTPNETQMLAAAFTRELGLEVAVVPMAVADVVMGRPSAPDRWEAESSHVIGALALVPDAIACVETPPPTHHPGDGPMRAVVARWLAGGAGRVVVNSGRTWAIRLSQAGCGDPGLAPSPPTAALSR